MQARTNGLPSLYNEHGATDAGLLDGLANLASGRMVDAVNRAMAIAKEALGMDVASVPKVTEGWMLFHTLMECDSYTGAHAIAVAEHSVAVARRMGLSEKEVVEVEQAALLHDIGKIGVGDTILNKPGALSNAEWEVMRIHPAVGAEIVASTKGLAHLAPAIRAEHECWDGEGYPGGLSGEQIPLASRIVLVCDAFHAMTSNRSYRKATGVKAALGELEKNAGTQFCPRTVKVFLGMVGQSLERSNLTTLGGLGGRGAPERLTSERGLKTQPPRARL